MVKYLKDRGVYVLFNTNGTLIREKKGRELIEAGPRRNADLRSTRPKRQAFKAVRRPRSVRDRIVRNVKNFVALKKRMAAEKPRLSLWLTGLRETLEQLPAFIRLAHLVSLVCPRSTCNGLSISKPALSGLRAPEVLAVRKAAIKYSKADT